MTFTFYLKSDSKSLQTIYPKAVYLKHGANSVKGFVYML